MKLKPYIDFLVDVEVLGEYEVPEYSAETKQSIINDFADVFANEPDEILSRYIDELLETAEWREVRIFPNPEIMCVHVQASFPNGEGAMIPVQVFALWDCWYRLISWSVLVDDCGHKDLDPEMQFNQISEREGDND